jgi:hypothetical protein
MAMTKNRKAVRRPLGKPRGLHVGEKKWAVAFPSEEHNVAPQSPEDQEAMARIGILLPKRPLFNETPEQKAARLAIGIAKDAKKVGWDELRLIQQLQRTHSIHEDIPPTMWRRAAEDALKEFRKKDV